MWLWKKRARRSSRDDRLIEFTVPGKGVLVTDGAEIVKLRLAAAEVGSSSIDLCDRDGDLAIALSAAGANTSDAAQVVQSLCRLAGLPPPNK